MADILIVDSPGVLLDQLEQAANEAGHRVKLAVSKENALQWVEERNFSLCAISNSHTSHTQEIVATSLWQKNPTCEVFVYGHEDTEAAADWLKLSGFSPAAKGKEFEILKRAFEGLASEDRESGEGFDILVVEDLDSPRDIICSYIESIGYSPVFGVSSAAEAMSLLEEDPTRFGVVVTDIRMPEIDGKKLIQFIRNHSKLNHIPIIALTAYGTMDTLIASLKAGASGFLVKPPKKKDLIRELARASRIARGQGTARLATEAEADQIRDVLLDKGFR